jgi:hypothetical protein
MELTGKQTAMGMKTIRLLKKHMKRRTTPTHDELIKLAKVCNADVGDIKAASATLMGEGVDTLRSAGVLSNEQLADVMGKIANGAGNHDNFAEFAEEVVAELPIDPGAKMLAAAFIGDD